MQDKAQIKSFKIYNEKKKYNTKLETVTNEPTRKAVFSRIQKNKVDSRKKSHVRRKGKDQIQQ